MNTQCLLSLCLTVTLWLFVWWAQGSKCFSRAIKAKMGQMRWSGRERSTSSSSLYGSCSCSCSCGCGCGCGDCWWEVPRVLLWPCDLFPSIYSSHVTTSHLLAILQWGRSEFYLQFQVHWDTRWQKWQEVITTWHCAGRLAKAHRGRRTRFFTFSSLEVETVLWTRAHWKW